MFQNCQNKYTPTNLHFFNIRIPNFPNHHGDNGRHPLLPQPPRQLLRRRSIKFSNPLAGGTLKQSSSVCKFKGGFSSGQNGCRSHVIKATSDARKQVEIVYNLDEKLNRLADEVDMNAGLSRLTLFSPCKINVFLRITNKRSDGFHDLASLFHVITFGDKIKFSLSPSKSTDRLSTNVAGIPLDERNLIIKALNLYRKKTGSDKFFRVHVDKRVPTGAGLGGGSSNAATALWAANQFSGGLATEKELQEWSGEIGSDVPFFFSNGAAYCTGRGEIVQDIPSPVPFDLPMVLIKPPEACSTAEVYKWFPLDVSSTVDPLALLEKISKNGISQDVCVNDLEPPAFEVLPSSKRLKQRIISAGHGKYDAVFMSGSGSTIVGVGSPDPPNLYTMKKIIRKSSTQKLSSSHVWINNGTQNHLHQMSIHLQTDPVSLHNPKMDVCCCCMLNNPFRIH